MPAVVLVGLLVAIPSRGAGQAMEDPTLRVSTVVSGLSKPTTMAFLAPRELLVLEKNTGRVVHIKNGAIAGTAINLAVNFASARGALGIALHPQFASNRFVYIFWTWKGSGSGPGGLQGSDSIDPLQVAPLGNRVDRFVWNGTSLVFNRNILLLPARHLSGGALAAEHTGGVLAFGADGKLYALAGDQHLRGKLQNVTDGPSATNANFTGVIVRLNADGSTPATNPFFNYGQSIGGSLGANIQRVFAYGIRNSFGMAADPLTGRLWMQENGDDAFDEINRVPAGLNSRWIQAMGPSYRYGQYRNIEMASRELDNSTFPPQDLAPTFEQAQARLYDLPGSQPLNPAFSWKHTPGLAGLGFLNSTALGSAYYGDLFVGDVRTGSLYRFNLNSARSGFVFSDTRLADRVADNAFKGDLAESESLTVGSGFGIVTDIETGPNGNLFVVSLSNGAVYQISKSN